MVVAGTRCARSDDRRI